ncbi:MULTISPECIES: ATP-binding cassette domain-containing protein [unclassified Exiguobacterium]|uniref:ATP-binding cassette domain-containing protein n=1 Tax=unclassified Exiguobacterium TaxID=2644629 RepID=UPI001BE69E51
MIYLEHVTKAFASGKGIFDVSFSVEPGMVFGFIGPNGAGKSTALRQLMGLIAADSGHATIGGFDCWVETKEVKRLVGYLPGEISLPGDFTGDHILTSDQLTLSQVLRLLTAYDIRSIQTTADDLEHVFLHYYGEGDES